jgi:pimeloyl-ACP methyl ester carboxylesterase
VVTRSPYAAETARLRERVEDIELRGARTRLHRYDLEPAQHRMIFLHGLRGDHHGLEPIVAHLDGLAVAVPDLPGFGQSEPLPRDAHDVEGYVAWTRALLTALAPAGDVVLAGHSFGSIVAAAAVAGGAPVRGLVLVNPIAASALAGPRVVATRATLLYHRIAAALPERAGTTLLRSRAITRLASAAMVRTRDRRLRRWIHAEHDRRFNGFADRRVLLEAFGASVGSTVGEFADRITVPTLLVAGERDDIAPVTAQRALVDRFPDARLVVLPGTGHLAHYETPGAVAAAITRFVATLATDNAP